MRDSHVLTDLCCHAMTVSVFGYEVPIVAHMALRSCRPAVPLSQSHALCVKAQARYAMQCDGNLLRCSRYFNMRFRSWLPWPFGDGAPRFHCLNIGYYQLLDFCCVAPATIPYNFKLRLWLAGALWHFSAVTAVVALPNRMQRRCPCQRSPAVA